MFVLASLIKSRDKHRNSITYQPLGIAARRARLAFNEMNETENRDVNFE